MLFRGKPLPEKSRRYASLHAKIFRPSLKGRVDHFAITNWCEKLSRHDEQSFVAHAPRLERVTVANFPRTALLLWGKEKTSQRKTLFTPPDTP